MLTIHSYEQLSTAIGEGLGAGGSIYTIGLYDVYDFVFDIVRGRNK